jgi:copper transport protein
LLWIALAALPGTAWAHAGLVASDPAGEAVLATAPQALTLTFSEPVEPLLLRMVDGRGQSVEVSKVERDGARLILSPPLPLGQGAHVLSWRVISGDGHPVGGSLTFWVGQRGTAPPGAASAANAPLPGAIWAARLAVYLGLLVGAGGAFFIAWLQPATSGRVRAIIASFCGGGLVATGISVGLQGLDALAQSFPGLADPASWRAGASGSFGGSAGIGAVALLASLASLRANGPTAKLLTLAALLGVGLALASSGHAATAEPRVLTVAAVFLHGVSLAFWIGALLPLAFAMGEPAGQATASLLRFSRAIPWAVGGLLASGLLLAVVQLAGVAALWSSDYGRVLSVKLALVALLLAVAVWNRFWLTPQLANWPARKLMQRSIAAELVLVLAILSVVGLWRFTPPPRALVATDDSFFTHLHAEKAMASVTIAPGHAGPVEITVGLTTPEEAPLHAMAVSVALANPALGIEPATAEAAPQSDGRWRVQMTAATPGSWTLTLSILISDFDKVVIQAPILIK